MVFDQNEYNDKYNGGFRQAIADARFVVLEKRYDAGLESGSAEAWTLTVVYNTTPLATNSQGSHIAHQLIGGLMDNEDAKFLMKVLFWNCPAHKFNNLNGDTRRFITHNIAPIEWHNHLDNRESSYMDRLTIFSYTTPNIPENLDELDEAYFNKVDKEQETSR